MVPERRCILLFARSPRSEAIAKRLPGGEAIFQLAIRRVIEAAKALSIDLIVAGSGASLPPGTLVLPQRGRTFGERFSAAFSDARRLGYQRIVAVGSDTPSLRTEQIEQAFEALERHPIVLGPSDDGGVYLIAARDAIEEGFAFVRWQVRSTLADLSALRSAFLLEPLADVDDRRDLDRLDRSDRELARAIAHLFVTRPIESTLLPPRLERIVDAHAIRGPPR